MYRYGENPWVVVRDRIHCHIHLLVVLGSLVAAHPSPVRQSYRTLTNLPRPATPNGALGANRGCGVQELDQAFDLGLVQHVLVGRTRDGDRLRAIGGLVVRVPED
jgi:hypothetical protein